MKNLINFKLSVIFVIFISFNLPTSKAMSPTPDTVRVDTAVFRENLRMLSVGLTGFVSNAEVKNIMYFHINFCVDDYWHIRIDSLISYCNAQNIDIKSTMNDLIYADIGGTERDFVGYILEYFASIYPYPFYPHISIPNYLTIDDAKNFIDLEPNIGYYFEENNYPVTCINSSENVITLEMALSQLTWLVAVFPKPFYFFDETASVPFIHIVNCYAYLNDPIQSPYDNCACCYSTYPSDGIPFVGGPSMANHELEIVTPVELEPCLDIVDPNPLSPTLIDGSFARINKIAGQSYYRLDYNTNDYITIRKLDHPIIDGKHYGPTWNGGANRLEGDVLTICGANTKFNTWDGNAETGTAGSERYVIGYGGVYRLYRPGIPAQKALFFYMPYVSEMWFDNGPDLRLRFITADQSTYCSAGINWRKFEENYETNYCDFCGNGAANFGFAEPTDVIASTDENTIMDYWSDNVITIGLSHLHANSAKNNIYEINAESFSQSSATIPGTATLIKTFSLSQNGDYDIGNWLIGYGNFFANGTELYFDIEAHFSNGEYINLVKFITTTYDMNGMDVGYMSVQIRGNILGHSSSATNYEIKVYQN